VTGHGLVEIGIGQYSRDLRLAGATGANDKHDFWVQETQVLSHWIEPRRDSFLPLTFGPTRAADVLQGLE
jgi:hypothetical protein